MPSRLIAALGVALLGLPADAAAQALSVAAASDLQTVLPALARQFEAESGHPVRLTFGSSGNFFSQIQNGAPFDVFFSADIDYPRALAAAGQADAGPPLPIRRRQPRALDAHRIPASIVRRGLAVTADDTRAADCHRQSGARAVRPGGGRRADAPRRSYDRVRSKLVLGENISQAAQFVQSGNAQVGILALSLARRPALRAAGTYVADRRPPCIRRSNRARSIVSASRHKPLARAVHRLSPARPDIVAQLQALGFSEVTPADRQPPSAIRISNLHARLPWTGRPFS